jgi:putative pyruvate formate lyase activating enzyme
MRIAWMGLHRGEEPPLVGEKGSGTVFFTGCPLHCRYCQNRQISTRNSEAGTPVTVEQFASLLIDLQSFGAANVNLVTGTHFIPSIIQSLELARQKGVSLPVLWNSSGFEAVDALKMIDPHIDTYLIDLKTLDVQVAKTFCGSADYIAHIEKVIGFLVARHPATGMEQGVLRGTLVRHLLFPGTEKATEEVLRWFAAHAKHAAWLSLMVQFVPPKRMEASLPEITEEAYDRLLELLDELGIEDGFVQELADNIPWIPDFERDNPFPRSFADPLPEFLQLKHRLLNR